MAAAGRDEPCRELARGTRRPCGASRRLPAAAIASGRNWPAARPARTARQSTRRQQRHDRAGRSRRRLRAVRGDRRRRRRRRRTPASPCAPPVRPRPARRLVEKLAAAVSAGRLGPRAADPPQRVGVAAAEQARSAGRPASVAAISSTSALCSSSMRAVSRFERRHLVEELQVGGERNLAAGRSEAGDSARRRRRPRAARAVTSNTLRRSGWSAACSASVIP